MTEGFDFCNARVESKSTNNCCYAFARNSSRYSKLKNISIMTTFNRVRHSQSGFIRRMQMSQDRLWIMVEGLFDRAFYGRICEANKSTQQCSYKICLPRELPDFTGDGKKPLLSMYKYLSMHKLLTSKFRGEKTSVLFLLDKDVDDLTRRRIRSKYVIYTEYYSADNYVFRFGDLCAALSSWSLLDIRSIKRQIGEDAIRWTENAATNWRRWVEHCILVAFLGIKGVPTFRTAGSLIHDGPYGNIKTAELSCLANLVMQKSGLTREQFEATQEKIAAFVENVYRKGAHDKIFNGKWYRKFLAKDAQLAAGGRQCCTRGSEEQLAQSLLVTLDYTSGWTDCFHRALDKAVLRLR